jgi:DNA ligase-1
MTQLHYWIQNNGIQKFGPVRVVRPQQVFLIAYDKSIKNLRLKAGYTLKNAQIIRWETKPGPEHKICLTGVLKDQI